METKLIVCFDATEGQIQALKKFCREKIDSSYIVSVRAIFTEDMVFSLSVFANRPEIFFGVYSKSDKSIHTDIAVPEDMFSEILNDIDDKYTFATTRKPPKVNEDLALAWIRYINNPTARKHERTFKL